MIPLFKRITAQKEVLNFIEILENSVCGASSVIKNKLFFFLFNYVVLFSSCDL